MPIENVMAKFQILKSNTIRRFESKLEKLQTEVSNANQQLTRSSTDLSRIKLVGPVLAKIIQIGLRERCVICYKY